jgi:hypothetical protein
MRGGADMMNAVIEAIVEDDRARVQELLKAEGSLARSLFEEARFFDSKIFHWIYVKDTPLHLAAAGYRVEIAQLLLAAGADPNERMNHRRSGPLHYAADGYINGRAWNAERQVRMIEVLLDAGAEIDAQDRNGATALHRAVRTRCAAAVKFLLERGADRSVRNRSGSVPFDLANRSTGRGGSGAAVAKVAQREIIRAFERSRC